MKSEVFAEDIEALLARLEGVAGARVVATEAGDIDRIFVTVSASVDPPAVRRAITAALMSEYALPVAGWRIHVARLRVDERPPLQPALHRLQETIDGDSARIVVELQAPATEARLIGSAKGSADVQARLRLAAEATMQAVQPLLATEDRKAAVEDITTVRLGRRTAVIVAVAVGEGTLVGAAPVIDAADAEAAVRATLDAMAARETDAERSGGRSMKNRREELDALRAEYRRLRASRPADAPASGEEPGVDETEDTTTGLPEIRPERRGGAAEMRDRTPAPRRGLEDDYFRYLAEQHIAVDITCRDGYHVAGIIRDFGTYSLMVDSPAGRQLLFKHAIISVRELGEPAG